MNSIFVLCPEEMTIRVFEDTSPVVEGLIANAVSRASPLDCTAGPNVDDYTTVV